MAHTTVFSLQGLTCMGCAGRVKRALEAREDVQLAEVNLNYAKVVSDASNADLIASIEQVGYQAQVADRPDSLLTLSGLTCGHCIASTQKALEAVEGVIAADVSLTEAKIYGSAEISALIAAVEQVGYQAKAAADVACPKSEPLATSAPPEVLAAAEVASPAVISAQAEAVATANTDASIQLLLEGMTCASCVSRVEKALQGVKGVAQARVNLAERSALITGSAQPDDLIKAVVKAGYGAEIIVDERERRQRQQQASQKSIHRYRWQSFFALIVAVPMMAWGLFDSSNMMVTPESRPIWLVLGLVTLAVLLFAGGHFFVSAGRSLRNKSATMDTLVALGTGTAWFYSMTVTLWPTIFPLEARHVYFEASAMIIGLINLGRALEQQARQRSSKALERLLDLTPPTARVVTPEGEQILPLAAVEVGMTLRLTTGDRVPVDGEIIKGEAWLDESMLTGEAIPQQKLSGATVHAGTVVNDGTLLFRSAAVGNQTILARIIKLVRQAQSSKPAIGQLTDRISAIFVPVVVVIAIISALIWYFVGPSPSLVYAFTIATTVLIIACPCALGLAIPMSIISGVGRAAEFGILVRDADALQQANQLDTIVFDKTGTLTQGKPLVTAIYTFNNIKETQALSWAGGLELGANHPLAQAILTKAAGLELAGINEFRTLPGLGVSGTHQQHTLLLGNVALLHQQNIDISAATEAINTEAEQGATPVLLAIDGKLAALLAIRDPLRSDSIEALARLHQQGYRLVMLTGDNQLTADVIAKEVGIDTVIAGVLPDGKSAVIKQLQAQGQRVAMVGDGINDAPALALADVGIAMGGGSDIAIETAAITLMRHSIHGVADALALSKATLKNMQQNLFGAFIYNTLGIPIAAGILYPFTGMLLNPMIAAAAMALSSITVVTNANRLLRFKPKE